MAMSTGSGWLTVGELRSTKCTLMTLLFLPAETAETNSGGRATSADLTGFAAAPVCDGWSVGASSHAASSNAAAQATLSAMKRRPLQLIGILFLPLQY